MTVIAWRNGMMACDSCWTFGDIQVASAVKIKRLSSGALLGQAGDNDCRVIDDLLDRVKDPLKLPTREQLNATKVSFIGLLALQRGGVYVISTAKIDDAGWVYDDDDDVGVWTATTMGGYAAVGSGANCALAAMDAGANARQAVEIACRREIHCRLPVHVRHLADTSLTKSKRSKVK